MKCRLCGRECPPNPNKICRQCADKEWDEFREAVHQYAQRIGLYDSIKEQLGIVESESSRKESWAYGRKE